MCSLTIVPRWFLTMHSCTWLAKCSSNAIRLLYNSNICLWWFLWILRPIMEIGDAAVLCDVAKCKMYQFFVISFLLFSFLVIVLNTKNQIFSIKYILLHKWHNFASMTNRDKDSADILVGWYCTTNPCFNLLLFCLRFVHEFINHKGFYSIIMLFDQVQTPIHPSSPYPQPSLISDRFLYRVPL